MSYKEDRSKGSDTKVKKALFDSCSFPYNNSEI